MSVLEKAQDSIELKYCLKVPKGTKAVLIDPGILIYNSGRRDRVEFRSAAQDLIAALRKLKLQIVVGHGHPEAPQFATSMLTKEILRLSPDPRFKPSSADYYKAAAAISLKEDSAKSIFVISAYIEDVIAANQANCSGVALICGKKRKVSTIKNRIEWQAGSLAQTVLEQTQFIRTLGVCWVKLSS